LEEENKTFCKLTLSVLLLVVVVVVV